MKKFLLFAAMAAAVCSADATVYIVGADTGWDPSAPVVLEAKNGVYTYKTANGFKISTTKGSTSSDWAGFNSGAVCVQDGLWNIDASAKTATGTLTTGDADIANPFTGFEATYTFNEALNEISAYAPDYVAGTITPLYLRGEMNDWAASPDWELTSTDGVTYTKSGVTIPDGKGFKIADANWSGTKNWGGGNGVSTVTANETYTLNLSSQSTDLTAKGIENATFVFNAKTSELKITAGGGSTVETPAHLYLIGSYNNLSWDPQNSLELTKNGSTFSISDVEMTGSCNFSFATVQGTWDDVNAAMRYGAGLEKDVTITLNDKVGTAPVFGAIDGNMKAFELAKGTYDFSVAFAADGITLTVTQKAAVARVEDLVLTGAFNDWANNDPSYKFTKGDNDTYTLTVAKLPAGEFKVKTAVDEFAESWGTGAETAVTNNVPMEAWLGSPSNFVLSEDLNSVTITFVRSDSPSVAASITIAGTSGVESVEAAEEAAPAEYFNLQGIRVANPEAGQLYIVRQGNKVSKVIR